MEQTLKKESCAPYKLLPGMPEGQDARMLAEKARELAADGRALIHIALDDTRIATLSELLTFFAPDVRYVTFPAWDCLPYDRVSPNGEIVARRVAALSALLSWQKDGMRKPRIVLTTLNAATQRVTPRTALEHAVFAAKSGETLEIAKLQSFLEINGYLRTDTVREPGEYAIRGGIVDLFPPGYAEPLRIDMFGQEIESIHSFDPVSQRSGGKVSEFHLFPATEFFMDEESVSRFRAGYRDLFGVVTDDDPLYEAVSAARRYNGMDHWLPLFFDHMDTLFDYAPGAAVTLDAQAPQARNERLAQIKDFHQARRTLEESASKKRKDGGDVSLSGAVYHPLPWECLYIGENEWAELTGNAEELSPFSPDSQTSFRRKPESISNVDANGGMDPGLRRDDDSVYECAKKGRDFSDVRAQNGDVFGAVKQYISDLKSASPLPPAGGRQGGGTPGKKIIIAAYSSGSRERLRAMMAAAGFANFRDIDEYDDLKNLEHYETGMAVLGLEHGFAAPDLVVLTEQDILGDRLARRAGKKRKADNFLTEVSSLSPGDLVVHVDHGVGRFVELETMQVGKTFHDCLKIEYEGGDKLYVPVENIEVLTRFGSDEGIMQLDKLGGAGWQARKARVKKDLLVMADGLLKIAAARQLQKAESLPADAGHYTDFAARFPYQETEDQQRSIDDTIADLARAQPMDRLVCGDVGFGKTEVALRAAYVAAQNGAQVAVAVPTTLLARQHYRNFTERFGGTGLRVAQLSRMVNAKESEEIKKGLADGSVNIVIGTHALFGEKIKFAHLGLLVIDEEQRFGVKQKERLKELKSSVHVLTLTATPIPRTLQMALTGVRDMSIIATPPVDRLAIRTFILPYDPLVIREAILRERHRGGQTFYVCPRIKDIEEVGDQLKELVPEVKIIAAHGQMSASDLEDRMSAFYDGQYDVLLATNIIENGLDIPTANTMIIHRSDLFGLAQLYQIRGRIGRSKQRAYAYLTYSPHKILTPQAQKRLEVMETLDTLGAGFQLASHDMDIRGAGNLLGEEQSGHIKEVGVELYQQMLEEAVAAAREGLDWTGGETAADKWSPQINIGMSVLIPDHYVEDLNVRMSLYRRLTDLKDKDDIESFAAELIDRFGPVPEEVENLLQIVEIKQLCRAAGVDRVEAGPKGAVIGFHKDRPPHVAALMKWVQEKGGAVKLRPDQKLVAIRQWDEAVQRVKGVRSLMGELVRLV